MRSLPLVAVVFVVGFVVKMLAVSALHDFLTALAR